LPGKIGDCPVVNNDGMFNNARQPVRISDVTDGTSKTLCVGEVTGGASGSRKGHSWGSSGGSAG
jgi:hypothetical protein